MRSALLLTAALSIACSDEGRGAGTAVDLGARRINPGEGEAAVDALPAADAQVSDRDAARVCPAGRSPAPEICDGADNDCDGQIDEDYSIGAPCEGLGECPAGVHECDGPGAARCSTMPGGSASPARPELCDWLDNDCDGEADEDALETPCYEGPPGTEGVGVCRGGTKTCLGAGVWSHCREQVLPGEDLCDGLDNDCDGALDEGFQPQVLCGAGPCADGRPSECREGVEIPCEPRQPAPDDATCDGVDDDCDGAIDEDYLPDGRCGEGPCFVGVTPSACVGGVEQPCEPIVPPDDTCDGADDNCDGAIDEGYEPQRCGVGRCRDRSIPSACAGGVETPCQPGEPAPDDTTCDGVDDDCDGAVDEDCAGAPQAPASPEACAGCGCCDPWWIAWEAAAGATYYQVLFRCSAGPEVVRNVGDVIRVGDLCNDVGLCEGGMCAFSVAYVRVQACNDAGCSAAVDIPAGDLPIACGGGCCC